MPDQPNGDAPAPAPALEAAAAQPAAPLAETPPAPDPIKLIEDLRGQITNLETERDGLRRDFRSAQSTSDANARKLNKQIERLSMQMEAVATRGMEPSEVRAWKIENELLREREARETTDADTQARRTEEEFRSYSANLLAAEGLDASNTVLREAWNKRAAGLTDLGDLKAALGRAIADVRKAEGDTKVTQAQEKAKKELEEERKKLINKERANTGPVDTTSHPAPTSPTDWSTASHEDYVRERDRRQRERERRRVTSR